jgi:hypothetical protein
MRRCFDPGAGKRLALIVGVAALVGVCQQPGLRGRGRIDDLPSLMLWAWERPEDVRGVDPSIGIAFLAQTITLVDGEHFAVEPRRQPLRVAAGSRLMAVTRIEAAATWAARSVSPQLAGEIASTIARTAALPRVLALQVDFDARNSQRSFYGRILRGVRSATGAEVPLSITALASWCVGDTWLQSLTIDEAVPMLFAMGPVQHPYRTMTLSAKTAVPACRGALGLSIDEPLSAAASGRRVYVFHSRPWREDSVAEARRLAGL